MSDKDLRNVIVNHLPPESTEETMRKLFEEFGEVESCKLVLNKSGVSMKYGFVVFKDKASVPKAIKTMNGKKVGDVPTILRVAYASAPGQPKGALGKAENIYVAGFRNKLTKEELKATFSEFGTILDIKMLSLEDKRYAKGVAFIKYPSGAEAESAIVNMHDQPIFPDEPDNKFTVNYAGKASAATTAPPNPMINTQAATAFTTQQNAALTQQLVQQTMLEMSQYISLLDQQGRHTLNTVLVVQNLPSETTEAILWELFGRFGAISHFNMPTYPNGFCKGYCFVHYLLESAAAQAAQEVHGTQLGNSLLCVSSRARANAHPSAMYVSDVEANILPMSTF
ncbi:Protein elav [Diplonema papillatum]|nr:Protein elav [Diplonema papillatum]